MIRYHAKSLHFIYWNDLEQHLLKLNFIELGYQKKKQEFINASEDEHIQILRERE